MKTRLSRIEKLVFNFVPNQLLRRILPKLSKYKFLRETRNTQTPITFELWYNQKVKGHCESVYWPVHATSTVSNWSNIYCGIETSPGFSPGNYIQALGKIFIGNYTQIGPNVGIISANHDIYANHNHVAKEVRIGEYSWIGMNSVILPDVELGDFTIVGAGSVVTKSFPEGYCVIAGNPAKVVKHLDKNLCKRSKSEHEYNGYIENQHFEVFRKRYLKI